MRGAATGLGDDTGDMRLIDRRRHGRGEVVNDDDGVLGKHGEVDDLLAQKLGKDARADVGDVCSAQAEHFIVHRQKHVLEHGRGVHKGLLGARTAVDSLIDGIGHARILSKNDVAAHDLGLVLDNGFLHVVGLSLRLIAEDLKGLGVALLLDIRIRNIVRLKRQIGLDGNHAVTDSDALRCVDSLIHSQSSLRVLLGHKGPSTTKAQKPCKQSLCAQIYEPSCSPYEKATRRDRS